MIKIYDAMFGFFNVGCKWLLACTTLYMPCPCTFIGEVPSRSGQLILSKIADKPESLSLWLWVYPFSNVRIRSKAAQKEFVLFKVILKVCAYFDI